jgi:hypothetical protein
MPRVPVSIKELFIEEEMKKLDKQLSGFSIRAEEIAEVAYHRASKRWKSIGYDDPEEAGFIRVVEREREFLKKILP